MEDIEKIEEQSQEVSLEQLEETLKDSSEENLPEVEDKADLSEAERGVPVGKFKNVEDLYEAYNNLQAEFTRKSQRLAVLEKEKTAQEPSKEETFKDNLDAFLSKNPGAVLYADEIQAKVMQDESLKNDGQAFDIVWSKILYDKLTGPHKESEPIVENLILKNNELKNLVIENYMKQLQEQKSPIIMSSGSGERVTKTVAPKPDNFEEAKKVVLDLLS